MSRRRINRHRNKRETGRKAYETLAIFAYLVPIALQVEGWKKREALYHEEELERWEDSCDCCCCTGACHSDAYDEWKRWWATA